MSVVAILSRVALLQGTPVTKMEFDFICRKTPNNLLKLKRIADDLGAMLLRQWDPVSPLFRVTRDRDGLQLDFMARIDCIRSFESLRGRSMVVSVGDHERRVASPADIIRSEEHAGREQDLALLPMMRRTLREKEEE